MRYRRPEYAGCHGFDAEGYPLEQPTAENLRAQREGVERLLREKAERNLSPEEVQAYLDFDADAFEEGDPDDVCADCGLDRANAQRDGNDLARNAAGQWKCPDCEWLGDE